MSNNQRDRQFDIKLQYVDKRHDIDIQTGVNSPPSLTIKEIIRDAKEFLFLDDVPLEDIRFVGYKHELNYYEISGYNPKTTLEELQITDDCILFFEPTENAAPPKLCHLKVIGPDGIEKREFPWYRAKTTVQMFFDFVIKEFSLEFIERKQIHFVSIIEELDFWHCKSRRLSEFNLHDGMNVHVQIIGSSTTIKQDQIVHVRCTFRETQFNLDISITSTIEDIKRKINERAGDHPMIDFELYNDSNDELVSDDSNRTLESFGVKPNETLYARFQLDSRTTRTKKQVKNRNLKYTPVSIVYHFPIDESYEIPAPLTVTIDQIIQKIQQYTRNYHFTISKMCSNKIEIDLQRDKATSLVDLGFQENDTIDVFLQDETTIVLEKEIASLQNKTDQLITRHQDLQEKLSELHNIIDTVFMRSAFYCLAYIPQLSNFFLNDFHNSNNNDIPSAYAALVRHTHLENQRNQSTDSDLYRLIVRQAPYFTQFEHQNPKEFIVFFLNTMHGELSKQNITIVKDLFSTELISNDDNKQEINLLSLPLTRQERIFRIKFIQKNGKETELPVNVPMNGRVENILDEFSHALHQPSIFYRLFATLPDGELNLSTPLNELPTDELILIEQETKLRTVRPKRLNYPDNKLTLEECLSTFYQQHKLSRFPPILIIELSRFVSENNSRQKNQTLVHFPVTGLDFNTIIPSLEEQVIYDLIAVNYHYGSIYETIYSASIRDFKTNEPHPWFSLLGKSVKYIEPDDYEYDIVMRSAYILFYKKRNLTTTV